VTVEVKLTVDTKRFEARFKNSGRKIAFAVGIAGNKTLVHMQKAGFNHVRSRVTVRSSPNSQRFLFGTEGRPGGAAGRLEQQFDARVNRFHGEIAMSPTDQSTKRRFVLPSLESGGSKQPRQGSKHVAVPLTGRPARPSMAGPVPPRFTFHGLNFRAYKGKRLVNNEQFGRGRRRKKGIGLSGEFGVTALPEGQQSVQWKGNERTFITGPTENEPDGAVWQRIGPERGDIRQIYSFESKPDLPDVLDWESAVADAAHPFFAQEMDRQFEDAFEHEKSRGRLL